MQSETEAIFVEILAMVLNKFILRLRHAPDLRGYDLEHVLVQ